MFVAEREAVNAAERAERKQQLRDKVSILITCGIIFYIKALELSPFYRFRRLNDKVVKVQVLFFDICTEKERGDGKA